MARTYTEEEIDNLRAIRAVAIIVTVVALTIVVAMIAIVPWISAAVGGFSDRVADAFGATGAALCILAFMSGVCWSYINDKVK